MKTNKIYQKNKMKRTYQKKSGTVFIFLMLLVSIFVFSTLTNEPSQEDKNNNEINKNNLKSAPPPPPPPPINIALNRPSWAGSEVAMYNSTNANDGIRGGSFGWKTAPAIDTSWWRVNFTRISKFYNVTLYFHPDSGFGDIYMGNFSILASNSSSFSGEQIEVASSINNNQLNWTISFLMVEAKYLQLNGTTNENCSSIEPFVNEIEVYGPPPPRIVINSPISSSMWETNTTHSISWTGPAFMANVNLSLYWSATLNLTISASTPHDGLYSWTLPTGLVNSTLYQIKIIDVANASFYNFSEYFEIFTSSTPGDSITVTNPDSTVKWETNSTHYIYWTSTGSIVNVNLALYWSATFNSTISASTPNDGTYLLTLPTALVNSTLYQIKITDVVNASIFDFSEYFEIYTLNTSSKTDTTVGSITVTNPTGRETWYTGSNYAITWTSTGSIVNVQIELYISGIFNSVLNADTMNDGLTSWTISSLLLNSTLYQIKISDIANSSTYGFSEYFTIYNSTIDQEIPGYNLYFLFMIIGITSVVLIKKKNKHLKK